MDALTTKAFAKINLSLDVLGTLPNGYHEVKMVMQTVSLYDSVELTKTEKGISLECSLRFLPTGPENLAYRAAEAFFKETGIDGGVKIYLKKHIPVGAGLALGGGLSNLAERLRHGRVYDYVRFPKAPKPANRYVYNLADFAIAAGGVLWTLGRKKK